jgi:hypothetical protein
MTEAAEDPCECKVWCSTCNCYLYSTSIYDPISKGGNFAAIACPQPEKCEDERQGMAARRLYFPPYH